MQGIQSLMQQGPVPGQAPQQPMQGMMPKPGAATPPAQVKFLETKPSQELRAMYNQEPSLALLTAYTKAVEREELDASMRGQRAMQQAADAPDTLADAIMSRPVMAAHGGIMQGYAGGGAVAFRYGGDVQKFNGGANEFGVLANPEAEAMDALRVEREQKDKQLKVLEETYYSLMMQNDPRAAQVKQQLDALSGRAPMSLPEVAPARQPLFSPEASALMQRQGSRGIASSSGIASVGRQEAPSRVMPRAQPQAPVSNPVENTTQVVSPEALLPFAEREAQLRSRMARPESLTKAEQAVADLMRANLQAQQEEAKTYGEEIRAARDAALARSQRNILSDPMSLLALAGSIDTRKGQGIGSLARGAAGLMGQREAAAEAARKEFTQAQRDERAMQANIRQTQMLEAQRQLALEQGKLNEVNAINDQLSALAMDREKFKITRGDVAFNQAMEGRKVAATERSARASEISASKPNEIDLALNRPEEYKKMLETRAAAQQLKKSPEQVRAETLERYADNWERLDPMQKGDLAKQGITNFQQYVRMRDQMAGSGGAHAAGGANDPLGIRK